MDRSRNQAERPYRRHKQDSTKLSGEAFYAHILLRVARNAERHDDFTTAYTFYRRARAFAPYDTDVLIGLARSLEKAGEALEASEAYGSVLAEESRHEEATAGLARTLVQLAERSGDAPVSFSEKMGGGGRREMAGGSGKVMERGDAPSENPATRTLAQLAPEKPTGQSNSGDGTAPSGVGKPEAKFQDVLKAVEWKEDPAGPAQPPAGAKEPAGVAVAASPPATVVPAAPSPRMPAPATKPSGYKLQLAAYRDKVRADAARSRLEARVKDLLGDVSLNVEKSGKVFRLRTSPLGGRTRASGMCARLKSRSISCFLVKPAKGASRVRKHSRRTTATPKMMSARKVAPKPRKTAKVKKKTSAKPAGETSEDAVLGWSDVMGGDKK